MRLLVYRCLALGGVLYLLATQGCAGQTRTQRALTTLDVGRSTLNLADSLIVDSCTNERVRASDDPVSLAETCLRAQAVQRACVAGWEFALHGVIASTDTSGDLDMKKFSTYVAPLIDAYPDLIGLVEELSGRDLPSVSELLGGLMR